MHVSAAYLAHFVHQIDPLLLDLGVVQFWYYGLAYCVGFLGIHSWLRASRRSLGLTAAEVYDLTLLFTICVLVIGRTFEVVVYEWRYYEQYPEQLLSFWRGGMASHGVLLGGVVGTYLFCRLRNRALLDIMDAIVIPAALFLALGRIGNFINGQIYGGITDVWWAVQFPDDENFRHPVTLYESVKNVAIVPILLVVRRCNIGTRGLVLAHFVFWYGFLRIFTDHYREYGTEFLGIGAGQYFNAFMAILGLGLIAWRRRKSGGSLVGQTGLANTAPVRSVTNARRNDRAPAGLALRRIAWIALLLLSLTIPSGWTRGVLEELRETARTTNQITRDSG